MQRESRGGGAPRRSPKGAVRSTAAGIAVCAVVVSVLVGGVATAVVGASPAQSGEAVDVEIVAGIDGAVPAGPVVAVRVVITSPRARVVDLGVEWDSGTRSYRVELPAGGPVELDLSVPTLEPDLEFSMDAVVRSDAGQELARDTERVEPRGDLTVVGIGGSLARGGAPEQTPTVAAVQTARLVALDDELLSRPGALDSMSGVVLAPADIDALGDAQRSTLRRWVHQGGDLALDVPASTELAIVDLPAQGTRTAVGAGWVRFTDGLAASGRWPEVVEPAAARAINQSGLGMDGFADGGWEFLGLVRISFLPVWVVLAAVFGTALLAGPMLWFGLRTRDRRRWMWVGAPVLSVAVAGLMVVLGQGVFARSEAQAIASVWSTPWGSSGDVVMGLKGSTELDLGSGTEVTGSSPEAVVEDTGDGTIATVDLPRNGYGVIGVSPVEIDPAGLIEVTAVAGEGTTADVTVTNRSSGTLRSVTVSGAGRARPFDDVGPGQSRTLPFEMSEQVPPFGEMFPQSFDVAPDVIDPGFMGDEIIMDDITSFDQGFVGVPWGTGGWSGGSVPAARGLVVVTGSVETDVTALGEPMPATVDVRSVAAVSAEAPAPAALRIEGVGPPPPEPVTRPAALAPTTTVGGQGAAPAVELEPVTGYVRMSTPAGRPASQCAVHTMIQRIERWDGATWIPLDKVGEPALDPRLEEPNEVQNWAFPELAAGVPMLLRVALGFPSPMPLMFDCAGPWQ